MPRKRKRPRRKIHPHLRDLSLDGRVALRRVRGAKMPCLYCGGPTKHREVFTKAPFCSIDCREVFWTDRNEDPGVVVSPQGEEFPAIPMMNG